MLFPVRRPRPQSLRAWWQEHVVQPLDQMYERLDEQQEDQRDQ